MTGTINLHPSVRKRSRAQRPVTMLRARLLLIAAISLVALRIHPGFLPDFASVYLADGMLFIVLIVSLALGKPRLPRNALPDLLLLYVVIILLTLILLILVFTHRADIQAALPNLFILVYYGFFLSIVSGLVVQSRITFKAIDRSVKVVLNVNFVIATLQLLAPPVLGPLVFAVYGDTKLRTLWTGYPRVYGSFANANWFGVFLVLVFCWFFCTYIEGLRPLNVFLRYSMIIGFLVLISGSRTAVFGLAFSFLALLILRRQFMLAFLSIVLVSISIGAAVLLQQYVPLLTKTIERFTDLSSGSGSSISSFSGRGTAWQEAWDFFVRNPWGYGDTKLATGFSPHNSYLALLLIFGVIGAFALGSWAIWVSARLVLFVPRTDVGRTVRLWILVFSAGFAAMLFAGEFLYTTQVMLLWLTLLALSWATFRDHDPITSRQTNGSIRLSGRGQTPGRSRSRQILCIHP